MRHFASSFAPEEQVFRCEQTTAGARGASQMARRRCEGKNLPRQVL